MPSHIIFSSKAEADEFVATTDKEMNYPEPFEMFCQVGGGIHADWTLGRGLHYAIPEPNEKKDAWAVPHVDVTAFKGTDKIAATAALAKATILTELPKDWYPVSEMIEKEE
jgi:hypothetical protein